PASPPVMETPPAAESRALPAERPVHERVVHNLLERIHTGESVAAPPSVVPAETPLPVHAVEHEPASETVAVPVIIEPQVPSQVPPVGPPEKRSVTVRIGTLELKVTQPQVAPAAPPETGSGFDGFDDIRNYRF